jgi:hypothetical protein
MFAPAGCLAAQFYQPAAQVLRQYYLDGVLGSVDNGLGRPAGVRILPGKAEGAQFSVLNKRLITPPGKKQARPFGLRLTTRYSLLLVA